ncbi:flavin prenyltransferase UbiX [Desulfomarina profundi]|uniref:Flavin prenyltransferase UbiX n=1 Tax=Desulfomarina profundi TaxID=2772557 RepID=A0A8D5JRC7_9BACT|nr:UbiX family flavin prenyltransferase [Desulfomarina profundi]BCL60921.1 flavin prenyltransferase UbiX [Desulfomarina profundi]
MGFKTGKRKILLGITGASGMFFVKAFLETMRSASVELHAVISVSGQDVLQTELEITPSALPVITKWYDIDDFNAAPSSGSSDYHAMVILPCTMGTLAAIAGGLSMNLIHRAADVTLKERRKLVLSVRETPFNRTHLQNMLAVNDAGGIICPVMPSFYLKPATLEEAALSYAWRLADQLDIEIHDRKRWKDTNG